MRRVENRTCVITGAAVGIGRACALRLAQEGARVALFDVLDTGPIVPEDAPAYAEVYRRGMRELSGLFT